MSLTKKAVNEKNNCPWVMENYTYGNGVIGLHEEIEHFNEYIKPTHTEMAMRYEAIKRIEEIIYSIWSFVKVDVYGSFRANMYLPDSDIDMIIVGLWGQALPLQDLEQKLIQNEIAQIGTVSVLSKAAVPVVKFTEKGSRLKFDISFKAEVTVQAADLIKELKWQYPQMPKLVMVLKQFMSQNKLNEVYNGGISSYAITLMCVSFLKLQTESGEKKLNTNLGVLLLKFLEFYGRKFDYFKTAISFQSPTGFIDKAILRSNLDFGEQWASVLSIEDPLTPSNDIGRSSYGALTIKHEFENAYIKLSNIVDVQRTDDKFTSKLGAFVSIQDELMEYRKWVCENFKHLEIPIRLPPIFSGIKFKKFRHYATNCTTKHLNNPIDWGLADYMVETENCLNENADHEEITPDCLA